MMRPAEDRAAGRGEPREDDQRAGHRGRRLMEMMFLLVRSAELAEEGQVDEAEHVIRRTERGHAAHDPDEDVEGFREVGIGQR